MCLCIFPHSQLQKVWLAVTVLVSIPIAVAKYLGQRNSGKGERAYFGSQLEGSVRPHEAIRVLLQDGATGLHIRVGKREKVAGSLGCVKGKPWQAPHETAVALHLQTSRTDGQHWCLAHFFLLTSSGVLAQEIVTQARTLSGARPQGLCPKACKFSFCQHACQCFSALMLVNLELSLVGGDGWSCYQLWLSDTQGNGDAD